MMRTRIREYRTRHSLTQEKLAEMVGVRRETIIFLAHNVAGALKTTVVELFIFDDE
jgi:DNA-binding XRE family transcriptional regulator